VFKSLSIKRNGLITPIVGKHIGIKTQTTESAARWGESYMYQRKTPTRSGDPLLKGPSNHLIATVLVKPPANLNSDEGWEMRRPKFFLWADVFSQLKDPRVKRLIGEKYVFYMNDIKYLELPTSSIVVENDI